jgi:HD-GYP domain-containing protein (c-di-GMP phosphodiesterase class II)
VKLVMFSAKDLRLDEALPFGVRDATGRLLLAADQRIADARQLAELASQPLFADEAESSDWRRRMGAAVDAMLRQNVTLKTIADARPAESVRNGREQRREPTLPELWEHLIGLLDAALRDARLQGDWLDRVHEVHAGARQLMARQPDASLYLLVHDAGSSTRQYCSRHSLLALVAGEAAAAALGGEPEWIDALGRAALTMNVAMARLQDLLAASDLRELTPEMRAEIDAHAARGAALLRADGRADPLWCDIVRHHHDDDTDAHPGTPAQQGAALLHRVDVLTAKLSRRRLRVPMTPVQAARQACLGQDGRPDAIGAALLKALGLYPPGSFVELASGELGIVVARGRSPNLPLVAGLVTPGGLPYGEMPLRDTAQDRFKVRAAVPADAVKVRPVHARVLALR